ncbi:C-type lectin domain family 4 member M-like [Alosa alosa]|uniref:C-type lectin domain family 4 member M-like n=1 Tax=Alosa alosa TaxID=278164 RepID=UPI0020152211|nr:C-type lectin domain family 4 member M-like [Alosa alosa]
MVLQQLVSWMQSTQSVNIRSMNPSKTEQTVPLKCQSDNPQVRRSVWGLSALCCGCLLSSMVLAILYGRAVRSSPLNPDVARTFQNDYRNLTDQLLSISEERSALQRSVWNLTELNHRLDVQCDELAGNNTELTSINRILFLEADRHLREENDKLVIVNAVFAEERENMSTTIGVLERQNENLTDSHQRELERTLELSALNDKFSRELREKTENFTLLWPQNQELLDQNVLLQSENLQLIETVGRVRSQKKECDRAVRNLTEALENTTRLQNQSLGREIAELRNGIHLLQQEVTSLNLYCLLCPPITTNNANISSNLSQSIYHSHFLVQHKQERRCRSCEDGWRLFRSSCYFLSRDSNSWAHGRTQCQSHGADLLVINSQEEQGL